MRSWKSRNASDWPRASVTADNECWASRAASGPSVADRLAFMAYMTIPVPRGRVLDGYLLTKFKKERDRIDELMGRDPVTTKVASAN